MVATVLSIVFGVLIFLLALGAFFKMYIKPLIDKKRGNVEIIAANKNGFKCAFDKKHKKVKISFKAPYANSAKSALTDMVKEMQKVDLETK